MNKSLYATPVQQALTSLESAYLCAQNGAHGLLFASQMQQLQRGQQDLSYLIPSNASVLRVNDKSIAKPSEQYPHHSWNPQKMRASKDCSNPNVDLILGHVARDNFLPHRQQASVQNRHDVTTFSDKSTSSNDTGPLMACGSENEKREAPVEGQSADLNCVKAMKVRRDSHPLIKSSNSLEENFDSSPRHDYRKIIPKSSTKVGLFSNEPISHKRKFKEEQQVRTNSQEYDSETSGKTSTNDSVDSEEAPDKKSAPLSQEKTGRWSPEEHNMFLNGLETFGKKWTRIALYIGTRTAMQVRTHAQKYFQKLKKSCDEKSATRGSIVNESATRLSKTKPCDISSSQRFSIKRKRITNETTYSRSYSIETPIAEENSETTLSDTEHEVASLLAGMSKSKVGNWS